MVAERRWLVFFSERLTCYRSKRQEHPSVSHAQPPLGILRSGGRRVGLYKILFYFEAFVHELIIRALPPPTCIARTIAILSHDYCAIYDPPHTPLLCAIHHYNIGNGNIV